MAQPPLHGNRVEALLDAGQTSHGHDAVSPPQLRLDDRRRRERAVAGPAELGEQRAVLELGGYPGTDPFRVEPVLDSVPAVLAVTDDPFIAFTSNALALLGLRSLFFVLAGAVEKFRYLRVGL